MSVNTIDQQVLKSGIIQLLEEDKEFLHKIVSLFQAERQPKEKKLPQDMTDEEHAEFMKEMDRKYANKPEDLALLRKRFNDEDEPTFDKSPLEMNDEEHAEFMKFVKEKYAIKWEDLDPLKELFKEEELSAEELVKML